MNDDAFWGRLNERLDDRRPLPDDSSLADAHPDEATARGLLGAARAMREGVARLPKAAPRADLEDRVLAALAAGGPDLDDDVSLATAAPVRRRSLATVAAAILATAAALTGIALLLPKNELAVGPKPLATATSEVARVEDAPAAVSTTEIASNDAPASDSTGARPEPLGALIARARDGYAALAVETRSSFEDVALLFPELPEDDMAAASPAEKASRWLDGLPAELPTPRPLGDAWKKLWDATELGDDRAS